MDDEYTGSGGAKFPIKWAAPEVLNFMRFSSKSDVWAFGVLMWEVFTCGKMPYGRMKNAEVVDMVQHGRVLEKPRFCPSDVYNVSDILFVLPFSCSCFTYSLYAAGHFHMLLFYYYHWPTFTFLYLTFSYAVY